MPGSFWKITALVGVLGLGCLIVLHAQQGMSDGSTNAAENIEELDEMFEDLAVDEDPLNEADAEDNDLEGALALNTPTPAASGDDDSDDDGGFNWEATPASSATSSSNPFDTARTIVRSPAGSVASTIIINEEDEDSLFDDDEVIDAEDIIVEADGVAVNDDADSDDIQLAANESPSPWATDTASSTQSGASATQSQTPVTRSPFLVLPPRSGSSSTTDTGSTTSAPSSAGPALQSLPNEYTSPALLPAPSENDDEDNSETETVFLEDDVQYFPAGPETQLPRTRTSSSTVTAAAADDASSGTSTTNPFGTSSSTTTTQPSSSAPRSLSFPAAGGASSGNPAASSTTSSSDPFTSSSVPATGQGASSIPSSVPSASSTSNPFGTTTSPPAATSDSPAPIRMSPGRVTLDDPVSTSNDTAEIEPTPATLPPSNTPANPFPLTTNPRPIDATQEQAAPAPPARITFPSVNPSSNPSASGSTSSNPFSTSPSSAASSTTDIETDAASSNPFGPQTAEAPESTTPSPFPSNSSIPGAPPTTGTAPANSYVGDGTIEGIVSSSHQPELQIEKVAPPQAVVGEFVIYEIHVRNVGQSAAHQVVIEDRIPLGSELKGTIPRAELVGTQLLWRLGTMEAGAEHIIKVRVIPTAAGEIGSVATVSFRAEVAATTVVTAPELSVDMNGPSEMAMGEEGAYQFTIRNDGDGEARDVVIVAMLPEGLAHPGGQELEYAVGNIAPGEVKTADLVLTAASSGSVSPVAQVTIAGQVHDQAQLDINLLESRIEVRRQGPIRRFVGRPATYSNVVTNLSSQPLDNVAVVEAIPTGLDLASVPEGGRFDPIQRTITWTVARLEAHESREFRSSIVAAQEGEWEGSLIASDAAGNRAQLATQIDVAGFSSLLVDVEHAGQPVPVGEQVSMRLTIRNAGTATAHSVQATIEVPPELEFVTAQGPVAHTIEGRTVTFEAMEGVGVSGEHTFDMVFTAAARGDARVRVSLTSTDLENPIVQEQAVRIFDEN